MEPSSDVKEIAGHIKDIIDSSQAASSDTARGKETALNAHKSPAKADTDCKKASTTREESALKEDISGGKDEVVGAEQDQQPFEEKQLFFHPVY